jgi:iron uptake system component EfeO
MTSPSGPSPSGKPPGMLMKLTVLAAALLVIAGGVAFYLASQTAQRDSPDKAAEALTVTITKRTCEPNELVVPAGRATFRIVNASDRPVEWEILDGVMVVEERENIAPGFTQTLTAKLAPGSYAITCGLLSNPRGTLQVTPSSEAASAATAGPSPIAFIAPLAEYKVFLALESAALAEATRSFVEAVKAGDLERAKALYAPARVSYKRMQPVVERIGDLDAAIDGRTDYFERREDDAGFTGFHRIEYGLFARNTTDGLATTADKLQVDVAIVRQRVRDMSVSPEALVAGAARVITQIAEQKVSGDDNRYSHTDLSDFQATLEGSRRIVDLLRPLAEPADPALAGAIDARFEAAEATLARFREGDGFVTYDRLGPDDRAEVARQMRALADEITRLNAALGLS